MSFVQCGNVFSDGVSCRHPVSSVRWLCRQNLYRMAHWAGKTRRWQLSAADWSSWMTSSRQSIGAWPTSDGVRSHCDHKEPCPCPRIDRWRAVECYQWDLEADCVAAVLPVSERGSWLPRYCLSMYSAQPRSYLASTAAAVDWNTIVAAWRMSSGRLVSPCCGGFTVSDDMPVSWRWRDVLVYSQLVVDILGSPVRTVFLICSMVAAGVRTKGFAPAVFFVLL